MKTETRIWIFHLLTVLQSIAINLAHPVTPTLINNLKLSDSLFGIAFASMSLGIFTFSLFWGELSSRYKKTTILTISLIGYGIGQFLFMNATTTPMIILARFIAGTFSGGFQVAQLNFLVSQVSLEERGKHLTISSILMTGAATLGYLFGGILGDSSINLVFILQIIVCVGIGILFSVVLRSGEVYVRPTNTTRVSMNPLKAFSNAKHLLNPKVIILMSSIFLAMLASTSFEQTFNYYLRDVFLFSPSYNGYLKVATGLVGIIASFTLCIYLIKKTRVERSYSILMLLMAGFGVFSIVSENIVSFLFFTFGFMAMDAMSKPLQQSIVSNTTDDYHGSHIMMGLYSAVRSMGMIGGALAAGFIYSTSKIGPFVFASIIIAFAGVLMWLLFKATRYQSL